MAGAKDFCRKVLHPRPGRRSTPRGVLLVGVPGTGKSRLAYYLGRGVGRGAIIADVGALRGSLQGQSEEFTRRMFATVDVMDPCVLCLDEVEKGLSGSESSGKTDGGTGSRMLGQVLTWTSDHKSDVFLICTCNSVAGLPPELYRSGRFDRLFFFDLPDAEERQQIWNIYLKYYGLQADLGELIDISEHWTGAEIESACRICDLTGDPLEQCIEDANLIWNNQRDNIIKLREWAHHNCNSATTGRLYVKPSELSSLSRSNGSSAPLRKSSSHLDE
jgi:SpoVK/Ycf46/Vps4 family AAA+-type ATPase